MDDSSTRSGGTEAVGERGGGDTGSGDRIAPIDAVIARLRHERLEVLPFYHDLRNQIVHPSNLHVETRYFFRKWKPLLGPVLTLLIMELRDRCYYNPRTGERRDYCWPSQEELARAIGVSVRTVIRALQDPLARKFVRVQHRYRYDPVLGKKVRTSSAYVVAMDDPLLPDDEAALTRMAAEQILAEETARRNQLQETVAPDLNDIVSPRSPDLPERSLGDNLPDRPAMPLTDNLSAIHMTDTLSEEEVLSGRDTHQKKDHDDNRHTSARRTSRTRQQRMPAGPSATTDSVADDLPEEVVQAYTDANDRPPTRLERQRLAELLRRFDPAARRAEPSSTGAAWLRAAIIEAVDSGSAFVAPRRIETICERWERAMTSHRQQRAGRRSDRRSDDGAGETTPPATDAAASERGAEDGPGHVPIDPFDAPDAPVIPSFIVSADRPVTSWQLWRLVTDELLREPIGWQNRAWLEQAVLIDQADGVLVIGTVSRFARDLLERRLGEPMSRVVAAILGEPRELRFVVSRSWLQARGS